MNLRKRVFALAMMLWVPVGAAAQTSQSTEAPEGTPSSPASAGQPAQESPQPTPTAPAGAEQTRPVISTPPAGAEQTQPATPTTPPVGSEQTQPTPTPPVGTEQTQPAPSAGTQEGQLPPVEVVQPKPKLVQPATFKPKPVVTPKVTPPKAVPAPAPVPTAPPPAIDVESSGSIESSTTTVNMSPVSGAQIPIGKVPGGVGIVTSSDFARTFDINSAPDALQERVPGVIVDDLQGNSFQTNVSYRGFEASPVNGVAQGIAVYQNGVRINESFGDIVNWDFLPSVAINNMTVVANNPVFGLNALGGAISITMKDGSSITARS